MTLPTIKEVPTGGSLQFISGIKSLGYKLPLILISVLLLFVVWVSSPPSFLSYTKLSDSQLQSFFDSPAQHEDPATISNSAPVNISDVHDQQSSPTVEQHNSPVNTGQALSPSGFTTGSESESNISPGQAAVQQQDTPSNKSVEKQSEPGQEQQSVEQSVQAPLNTTESIPKVNTQADRDPSNVTTEAVIPEDSQLVAVESDAPVLQDDVQQPVNEEKYIMPLLSFQVGTGNQLIEYKSAVVIARTLNRTLCLSPFFIGPGRHFGFLGDRHSGLYMEERYDTEVLSKFVKVASMVECMQKCDKRLDVHWRLRKVSKAPQWENWFNETPRMSVDFDRNAPGWSTTADVAAVLGPRNEARCVGLGGLFPGLRWKGVYFASSAYMEHSKIVKKATDHFQVLALGSNNSSFVSVHWRFEESNCRGHPLGLCFSRCSDGAVIANGRRSETWGTMAREGMVRGGKVGFSAVFVDKEDLSGAIYDQAVKLGVLNVYLATDGWLRGPESAGIVKWVVEDLRRKGVNVAGLWQIWGLPNFQDNFFVHADNIAQLFGLEKNEKVSNHMVALVEQELCVRSAVFLGSGQSSWSLAVADTRQGRQCKQNLEKKMMEANHDLSVASVEQEVINKILTIQYTPGPTCRGSKNHTNIPVEDEDPDSWLDYEACEARLMAGVGKCTRISS